jgi:hypothetical protein
MGRSIAVVWNRGRNQTPTVGKVELLDDCLRLDGRQNGNRFVHSIPFDEIEDVHVASAEERVGGRPTLVVGRRLQPPLQLAAVGGVGLIGDLATELSSHVRVARGR